jgi:biotin-(acetyl-CoA carboxylase) ligase
MVEEKKLAGILAETISDGPDPGASRAVVVGLGVNVRWPPPGGEVGAGPVPEDLGMATSLWRESGRAVEPGDLLDLVLEELDRRLDEMVDAGGRRRLASEYRGVCGTLGREVAVSLEGETARGRVVDITVEGHLLLDVGACIRTITAGDVVHLRG